MLDPERGSYLEGVGCLEGGFWHCLLVKGLLHPFFYAMELHNPSIAYSMKIVYNDVDKG